MFQNEPERGPLFDFERLIVYQKAMQLRRLINPQTLNPPKGSAHLVDHLDRAVDSNLLNVPEGNGFPRGSAKRRNHFRIALGSAKEAASAVNALRAKERMPRAMGAKARALLIEIVRMLETMSR
ncbi:MAG: four helix bundle protein [Planctomycetota bacterium]|jgi:four helix bundle protein